MEVTVGMHPAHSQLLHPKASVPFTDGQETLNWQAEQIFNNDFYASFIPNIDIMNQENAIIFFLFLQCHSHQAERLVHSANAVVQPVTASLCKKSPSNSSGVKIKYQNVAPLMFRDNSVQDWAAAEDKILYKVTWIWGECPDTPEFRYFLNEKHSLLCTTKLSRRQRKDWVEYLFWTTLLLYPTRWQYPISTGIYTSADKNEVEKK